MKRSIDALLDINTDRNSYNSSPRKMHSSSCSSLVAFSRVVNSSLSCSSLNLSQFLMDGIGLIKDANGQVVFSFQRNAPFRTSPPQLFGLDVEPRLIRDAPPISKHLLNQLELELIEYTQVFVSSLFGKTQEHQNLPIASLLSHIIKKTKIHIIVLITALLFLRRLKEFFPSCRGNRNSCLRLVMVSLILASKTLYDDAFDNNSWASVSCGLFNVSTINQMEREMLSYLGYKLYVSREEWISFLNELGESMAQHFKSNSYLFKRSDNGMHRSFPDSIYFAINYDQKKRRIQNSSNETLCDLLPYTQRHARKSCRLADALGPITKRSTSCPSSLTLQNYNRNVPNRTL